MLSRRLRGYLIGTSVGVAFGVIVDSIDISVLMAKRDKLLVVLGSGAAIVSAVIAAYNEPPLGDPKDRQTGPTADTHGDPD